MKIKAKPHTKPTADIAQKPLLMREVETTEEPLQQIDSSGGEAEEDLKPTNFNQAVTWATDWTTETMALQLKRGVIDLDPTFQRRDAWRQVRKSRFIESLVLGLPIPQIVLAERKEKRGTYFVIDGKQRLLTLKQFCGDLEGTESSDNLELSGLLVETSLNGKTYRDLLHDPRLNEKLTAFLGQTIRTIVIKNWPTEDFLYTVFHRLNSNSVPLSPQELRKALHPGPFVDFAERASGKAKSLQRVLGITEPDFRMRDVEILIRYFAFKYFIRDYRGNLKQFLDETCEKLNKRWPSKERDICKAFSEFEEAIALTDKLFGKNKAFRKFSNGVYEPRLNRAVFDIFLFYLSQEEFRERAKNKAQTVKKSFEELCSNDPDFLRSLETSTKTTEVVKKRFKAWGACLARVLGLSFESPFA